MPPMPAMANQLRPACPRGRTIKAAISGPNLALRESIELRLETLRKELLEAGVLVYLSGLGFPSPAAAR